MNTFSTVNPGVDLKKEALKNGAIWGAVSLVLFLTVWYVQPSLMASSVYSFLNFAINIGLAIFFTLDMRKKAGGYWSFSEALWNIFVMFLVSTAILYVFTILFGKFIDTSYPVKMKELIMENTESMLKKFSMSDEQVSEAMDKVNESTEKQLNPSFFDAIKGFGLSAIFYFIGAVIFALIFKKSNPNPWEGIENTANDAAESTTATDEN